VGLTLRGKAVAGLNGRFAGPASEGTPSLQRRRVARHPPALAPAEVERRFSTFHDDGMPCVGLCVWFGRFAMSELYQRFSCTDAHPETAMVWVRKLPIRPRKRSRIEFPGVPVNLAAKSGRASVDRIEDGFPQFAQFAQGVGGGARCPLPAQKLASSVRAVSATALSGAADHRPRRSFDRLWRRAPGVSLCG
jgi:hypothetical protein